MSEHNSRDKEFDVFICHASEDKEEFVRPLATELKARGLNVWYDEFQLEIGDNIRESIDQGLTSSRYGIAVLSDKFFDKEWTEYELNGLIERDTGPEKVILPIWYDINEDIVQRHSPPLAGKFAAQASTDDISKVAGQIYLAIKDTDEPTDAKDIRNQSSKKDDQLSDANLSKRTFIIPVSFDTDHVQQLFEKTIPDRVHLLCHDDPSENEHTILHTARDEILKIIKENSMCYDYGEVKITDVNFHDFVNVLTTSYEILYVEGKRGNQAYVDITGGTTIVGMGLSYACSLTGVGLPVYSVSSYEINDGMIVRDGGDSLEITSLNSLRFISPLPDKEEQREFIIALNSEPKQKNLLEIGAELGEISDDPSEQTEKRSNKLSRYSRIANHLTKNGYLEERDGKYQLTEFGYMTARLLEVEQRVDQQFADFYD